MSILQKSVRRESLAVPVRLSNVLLHGRFDFRQKAWGFPRFQIGRDGAAISLIEFAALAAANSKNIFDFSDPSLGGAKPSKSKIRRMGNLANASRHFGENQETIKEK